MSNPFGTYFDMHKHATQAELEAELSRVFVPALARRALAMKGGNERFDLRFFVQKDMWDNYGDMLHVTELDGKPAI